MTAYLTTPLWPAFLLVGFFFGITPMVVLYGVAFVVAAGHAKGLPVWKMGVLLTAITFVLLYLALLATEI